MQEIQWFVSGCAMLAVLEYARLRWRHRRLKKALQRVRSERNDARQQLFDLSTSRTA